MANMDYREAVLIDSSPEPDPPCRIAKQNVAINSNSAGKQPRSEERFSLTKIRPNVINQNISFMHLPPIAAQQKPQPRIQDRFSITEGQRNEATQSVSSTPQLFPFSFAAQQQQLHHQQRAVPLGSGSLPIGFGNNAGSQSEDIPSASLLNTSTAGLNGPNVVVDEYVSIENHEKATNKGNHNEGRNEARSAMIQEPSNTNVHIAAQPITSQPALQCGAPRTNGQITQTQTLSVPRPTIFPGGPPPTGPRNNEIPKCDFELPYKVEHSVLCTVQKLLEGALFDFAKAMVPRLLQKTGWESQEQGELNIWLTELRYFKGDVVFALNANNTSLGFEEFAEILSPLHELRHVAVHRRPVGTYGLRRFMPHALELVLCLRDFDRHKKLRVIEWGVWQLDKVNLEVELSRPEKDFKNMDIPDRATFLRVTEISGNWQVPGSKRRPIQSSRSDPRPQPAEAADKSTASQPVMKKRKRSPSTDGPTNPSSRAKRRKDRRSRSPPVAHTIGTRVSKRLKAAQLAKQDGVKIMIDLTEDDEKEEGNPPQPSKTTSSLIIDLTED